MLQCVLRSLILISNPKLVLFILKHLCQTIQKLQYYVTQLLDARFYIEHTYCEINK